MSAIDAPLIINNLLHSICRLILAVELLLLKLSGNTLWVNSNIPCSSITVAEKMFTRYPFRNVTLIADYSKLIPCSSSSSFRVAAEKLAVEFTPAEYKHTHLQMFHPCSSINFSFCCYYLPAYRFLADVLSEGEC